MNCTTLFKKTVFIGNNALKSRIIHHQSHHIRTFSAFQHNTNHHTFCNNLNNISYTKYIYNSYRKQSTEQTRSNIDEVLLSKQEDPMVLKQKEELLRAFASQLSKSLKRFETSRKLKLKFLLKTIYGCTVIEIKQYCTKWWI